MPSARLLTLGLLAGLATACSGATPPSNAPTSQATTSMAAAEQPETAQPPKDGPPKVGQKVTAEDDDSTGSVTVLRFRQPLPSQFPPDRKGYEFAGIEVSRCFDSITAEGGISVGWEPWSLGYPNGNIVQPPSSWSADHFDVVLYPRERPAKEGRCIRGWIPYEVRKNTRPATVNYMVDRADPLEWIIR